MSDEWQEIEKDWREFRAIWREHIDAELRRMAALVEQSIMAEDEEVEDGR